MTTEPSYVPVVASLEDVTPIPGADRIVSATARGYRLVVGVDRKVGELGVVFPAEGVLDLEFAIAAGLLVKHPRTGEKLGGYLDDPPRIRNLVLRGVRTDALWIPLADFRAAVERAVRASSGYRVLANQPAPKLPEYQKRFDFSRHSIGTSAVLITAPVASAVFEKILYDFNLPLNSCIEQRCLAGPCSRIDVGTVLDKIRDHVKAVVRRQHQCCSAMAVSCINIGTGIDKILCNVVAAVCTRVYQRGALVKPGRQFQHCAVSRPLSIFVRCIVVHNALDPLNVVVANCSKYVLRHLHKNYAV